MHAAGVAFPEVLQTRGLYQIKPDLPFVPGSEVAGVVRTAPEGRGSGRGRPGGGLPRCSAGSPRSSPSARAWSSRCPTRCRSQRGAALPMNYLTAHFALVTPRRLQPGETVLVHGAAGGVGTAAVQLAAALGARVVAVVSSHGEGAAWPRAAGAHETVPADGFLDAVKELTGGCGSTWSSTRSAVTGSPTRCAACGPRGGCW